MPEVSVIAIDSSPQAEAAFQYDIAATQSLSTGRLWDQQKSKIKALEDKYRWKLNENGLAGKIITESGRAGEVIIRVASQEKATLLAIGSRGLSKFKRTIQGSVSDYVLHHAHCPVIICRQEGTISRSMSTTSGSSAAVTPRGSPLPPK